MAERVLAIGAHIDDIEIGCGGTLLKHRDAGDVISIAILKAGENLTASPEIRKTEQWESCKVLGVETGCAIFFDGHEEIEDVVEILDMARPTILYYPYEHDTHQDHNRASQVGFAVSRLTTCTVLRYLVTTSHSYYPNYLSVIDMEAKKKLVALFASQMERRPKFMEIMETQSRFFGSLIPGDGHHAEGFVLHRKIVF